MKRKKIGLNIIQEQSYSKDMEDRIVEIVALILEWYDKHRRILPWRENPMPYEVWISEIMLQQTRVEAVKPYFKRFIERLPGIEDLAMVEEEELLKLWEGLGYYSRARNLKKAAMMVMDEYGGELPQSFEELQKLPGIGSYTAGAIASIAYNRKAPAVDGNVLRVLSRVLLMKEDISKVSVKKKMGTMLLNYIPIDRPGAFNQALIEIGALICIPNGMPKCESCPLKSYCLARIEGMVMELPVKAPKKSRRIEDKTILLIKAEDKVGIRKRSEKGLLAGMYELPNLDGHLSKNEIILQMEEWGFEILNLKLLKRAVHIFSHVEWHMKGYQIECQLKEAESPFLFVEKNKLVEEYPIPTAFGIYINRVNVVKRR